ncbi:MAG: DoxX-like family protein [Myxococcales bacterium]|nr:DoxX-like family protein [Myxococcales bacterium]
MTDSKLLRWSVASVWLATGLLWFHPHFRAVGGQVLARLGLPEWLMGAACAGEVALGLAVALLRPSAWLTGLQGLLVGFFTAVLASREPMLLVHPFGMLSKNVPLLAVIYAVWLVEKEGWTARVGWLLRGGMAAVFLTEGLFPKILFQEPMEIAVVERSGLVPFDASSFLYLMGAAQAASGLLALVLERRWLRWLWLLQAGSVVLLTLLVAFQEPLLWAHPFGPLTKNVPIVAGLAVLVRRCPRWW